MLASFTLSALPITLLSLLFIHLIRSYFALSRVPGSFLARVTDIWRLIIVWRRDSHNVLLRLHRRHGDLVRIGPNTVSISAPNSIPLIYGIGKGFVKSDFYAVWQNIVSGKRVASLVFTTDEQQHAAMKRPIAQAYSLSSLVEFEPLIDSTTAVFLSQLDGLFARTGRVCDLGTWLQFYAFDVIGELTFSNRLGFLEKAEDVESIAGSVAKNFDRCSVLGQMPWLDRWTWKNPLYLSFFAKPVASPIIGFGQRRLQERLDGLSGQQAGEEVKIFDPILKEKVIHGTLPSKPDFLSRFLALHEEQPEVVTDRQLLAYLFMNINAGSDTIASTLRAIFYHLLKTPATLAQLRRELDEAETSGRLSVPLPTWAQCQRLPYLNATVKEALRINPALALPLERIVPTSGLQIGDEILPPGTIVGINPWVLQRDPRIFGSDAEIWRPERWLDGDKEKLKFMDSHLLAFGAGKRTCLGKNIAMIELTKLVPALLMRYDMELADPVKEWKVINSFAVRQEGLDVTLRRLST